MKHLAIATTILNPVLRPAIVTAKSLQIQQSTIRPCEWTLQSSTTKHAIANVPSSTHWPQDSFAAGIPRPDLPNTTNPSELRRPASQACQVTVIASLSVSGQARFAGAHESVRDGAHAATAARLHPLLFRGKPQKSKAADLVPNCPCSGLVWNMKERGPGLGLRVFSCAVECSGVRVCSVLLCTGESVRGAARGGFVR